jgi:urease accessory protein
MGITMVTVMADTITMITEPTDTIALSRLLQLASPMLPVGAYSYSQGLETAIEDGIVHDAATAARWIQDVLTLYLGRFELPILSRMCVSLQSGGDAAAWNTLFCAGRDTSESRAETLQMGYSLTGLLRDLDSGDGPDDAPISFPLAYARAAMQWNIPAAACVQAYAWSWLENQVAVAMKAIPIGQTAGQRILFRVGALVGDVAAAAADLPDDAISNFAPGLTLAACRHEVQYSRLFRS